MFVYFNVSFEGDSMKKRVLFLTTAVLAVFILTACPDKDAASEKSIEVEKQAEVIATVNGVKITSVDFDNEVSTLPDYIRGMAATPDGRKEMIETLIMRELILQQAKKDGTDKSSEVEQKLADIKNRIIVDVYLKKTIETESKISDAELQEFYDQNKEKFKSGEQVKASHILVKTQQEADEILAELKKGATFADLAKAKSIDSSASAGGDLGWFEKGHMVPVFEKAAFALQEGELSGVVKSEFGYHIINVTGKRPAGIRTMEESREQIKAVLVPEKQQQVFAQIKERLRKDAKIEVVDKKTDSAGLPDTKNPSPDKADVTDSEK
jgi:peptidyl-prolyl cis-trans isomerase C